MKITPLEIKRQQFKKSMRGYDPVEVETFLDMVSNEVEDLIRENKEQKDLLLQQETQLIDYKNLEKSLQQTLVQAQETSGKSIENSKREGEIIIKEAEIKGSQIVEKARLDFAHVKEEISQLKARKESVISRLKVLLSSELNLIKALEIEEVEDRNDPSKGTGKDRLELDEIMKKL